MPVNFLSDEASLFVREEPTADLAAGWLGCSSVGDVSLPESDLTPVFCEDPAARGQWKVSRQVPGEPGQPSFSTEKPLTTVNKLLALKGGTDWLLAFAERGDRTDPTNFDVALWFLGGKPTSRGVSPGKTRSPGDNALVMTSMEVKTRSWVEVRRVTAIRQTTAETRSVNGISFLPYLEDVRLAGKVGYAGTDGAVAASANVLKTVDGGGAWAACAAQPFAVDEHIGKPLVVDLPAVGIGAHRVIVPRIVTDAVALAEVGYSDDLGAVWSTASFGVNGDFITAFAKVDDGLLVAGLDGGGLYNSRNKGLSWSAWTSGITEQINAIDFIGRAFGVVVGDNNSFIKSLDSGGTWTAKTGPIAAVNLVSVAALSEAHILVGAANGNLYRTLDGGDTWALAAFPGYGAGSVVKLAFDPSARFVGTLVHNPGSGAYKVYRSFDGGVDWAEVEVPDTNTGINDAFMSEANQLWVVGEPESATGYIVRAS